MTHAEELGLVVAGVVFLTILAVFLTYWYESRLAAKAALMPLDPSQKNLEKWRRKLGIDFDPKNPRDPVAALIAAGEYFRLPGCEPGGPYYEETFQRVLHMMEDLVPQDRLNFWIDQVYRLYGSQMLRTSYKPKHEEGKTDRK
ncbi:MAG: hypothetical protein A3G34_01210 [Candidatus Lindowbacteria bacterium RIFCSPLOWO2_12_FULL_62_27]|nr:MAG: hypothetical protein A3G34_01210 [Candidatus Lindowbacteria bacterium RIFCSPLOWO2_12_FULL_62_27]OGH63690.1 MAG: hypothetical protein A3I06_07660 [Candidatus Lindowbacteria bacterium RIFCSPLOWO2_02_FULL_62_12]